MRPAERSVYQFDTGLPDLVTDPAVQHHAARDIRQRQCGACRDLLAPSRTTDELRTTIKTPGPSAARVRITMLDESLRT